MDKAERGQDRLTRFLQWCARQGDISGSDIYVDYPHGYVWQANQMGHILIGLGGTLVLGWLFGAYGAAFAVLMVVYAAKEAIDTLIAERLSEGVFPPDRKDLIADGLVDTMFVGFGGLVAVAVRPEASLRQWLDGEPGAWLAPAAILGTVVFFLAARAWYVPQKRRFDKSGMGDYVRLTNFRDNFREEGRARLAAGPFWAWLCENRPGRHLVIAGPPNSGRTTLALSLGAEAAVVLKRRVRYLSASRLAEKARGQPERPSETDQPWQVAEADLVIVDEITDFAARGGAAATLDLLTRTPEGQDVLARGLGGGAPRVPPCVVWTISAPLTADGFLAALAARYPGTEIAVAELKGPLQRTMRPDA